MIYKIIASIIYPVVYLYERFLFHPVWLALGKASLARIKTKGINVSAYGRVRVMNPAGLKLGDHIRIGSGCFLHAGGGIQIDDGAILSRNIIVYSAMHSFRNPEFVPYGVDDEKKPVYIGKAAWIGMNVSILPGVSIGDGAIVGMGAVITKDIEPYTIVAGNPHKLQGLRDQSSIAKLIQEEAFFAKTPGN